VTLEDCHSDHCITCGDEGIPMRVLRIDGSRGLALCETEDGRQSSVEIALVDVGEGEWVLVHAGVALAGLGGAAGNWQLATGNRE
jgi:hydrogenase maturation factor